MSRLLVPCLALSVSLGAQSAVPVQPPASYVRLDLHASVDGRVADDLQAADIEIREDGVAQKVESFRHVDRAAAARGFVVFLDTLHLRLDGPARLAFVRLLDRLVGPEDLVTLMTPETAASGLVFGPKAEVVALLMSAEGPLDQSEVAGKEALYDTCFPGARPEEPSDRAAELRARRRERLTLDAIEALVTHLRIARTERTAVLMLTDGWRLFGESKALAAPERGRDVSPRDPFRRGRSVPERRPATGVMLAECDADRAALALEDNSRRLREIGERANRSTVSFYPVLASGLAPPAAEETAQTAPAGGDAAARADSLRQLAVNTDGQPLLGAAGLERFLNRVSDDQASYYLIGYRSTNTRLDGRFRTITLRALRPGVQLRTRRGYRGLTADALLLESGGRKSPPAPASAGAANPRAPFRIRTASWYAPEGGGTAAVWIVGELDYATRRQLAWTSGATADVTVVSGEGVEVVSRTVPVASGEGGFSVSLAGAGGLQPGEYAVRVRLQPASTAGAPLTDSFRLVIPGRPTPLGDAVLLRRGPSTGPRHLVTADPRFQRSERIRVEMASTPDGSPSARMLDRLGNPMQVPVQVSSRLDASGAFRWIAVDASLAPLATGDYAIEVTLDGAVGSVDFSVVP